MLVRGVETRITHECCFISSLAERMKEITSISFASGPLLVFVFIVASDSVKTTNFLQFSFAGSRTRLGSGLKLLGSGLRAFIWCRIGRCRSIVKKKPAASEHVYIRALVIDLPSSSIASWSALPFAGPFSWASSSSSSEATLRTSVMTVVPRLFVLVLLLIALD